MRSRREFVKTLAGVAGACAAPLAPGFATPQSALKPAVTERLQTFGYGDVQLTGGPLKAQFDRVSRFYLELPDDNLLHIFRVRAGRPAPGFDMGGWYDADGFAPAHMFGQVLSALARFYANTGDTRFKNKVDALVEGFTATIAPSGFFYPCEKAARAFPAYTYDKLAIGLLDAYRYAANRDAIDVADRITRVAARQYLPPVAIEQTSDFYDESYTLAENLYELYETTGDPFYRTTAQRFEFRQFWLPFAAGQNVFPGHHAYSHVNTLCSAARAYRVTGNVDYFKTIVNAWVMLRDTQRYASGGWGPNEGFVRPVSDELGKMLSQTTAHFETPCGSYADLKLQRYLLRFTGDSRYAAMLERVLYNTCLGALDPRPDGAAYYYSSYKSGTAKEFFLERPGSNGKSDRWPCCAGTLPQVVSDYPLNVYAHAPGQLFVNLYTPSLLRWQSGASRVELTQRTGYPEQSRSELRFTLSVPAIFRLNLRVPENVAAAPQLRLNGQPAEFVSEAGWLQLNRRWQSGDRLEVSFDFVPVFLPVDAAHPGLGAFLYGPILLVALADGPLQHPRGRPQDLLRQISSLEFATLQPATRFVPWYRLDRQRYTTYVQLT